MAFLSWAAEPEMEERKLVTSLFYLMLAFFELQKSSASILRRVLKQKFISFMQLGFKWIFVLSLALLQAAYYRRLRWSVLKSRKLVVDVVN